MSAPASPAATTRLPGIEALRCVAALCVLLLHTQANFGGKTVFTRGYLGVDFFLMLSGFLMARIQEPRFAKGVAPWRWLGKRYAKLWPVMAAGTLLGLYKGWLRCHGLGDYALTLAMGLALVPSPNHQFVFPFNVPAWTIVFELLCNAAHLFVLRKLGPRGLAGLLVLTGAGTVWAAMDHGGINLGATPGSIGLAVPRALFAYGMGITLARGWQVRSAPPVPWIVAPLLMPALLVGGWLAGWDARNHAAWPFDIAFVVLAGPVMIAGALRMPTEGRMADAARLAGQLSFPLFALQMPVLETTRQLHGPVWLGFTLALAVGIAGAAWLAWRPKPTFAPAHA